ncbi:MAG: HEAT repeat domain-containing protein [Armatimonadota bacterium]
MARMTLEEKLAALERDTATPERLGAWLQDASNVVAARAAEVMTREGMTACLPALREAFLRLVSHPQPASVDKLCRAKEAIIQALDALGNADPDPYMLGMRHVQMEPVYGGSADTAPVLRGYCAIALARTGYPEAYFALTPLLFDPEPQPRSAAISALCYLGGAQSELLLRAKVLAGDANPDIISECFAGLLTLEPDRSLPFLTDYLHQKDRALVELAALALGNSRLDAAFPLLRAYWEENSDLDLRKTLLLAMALTRREDAFAYLLALMRDEGGTTAVLTCDALALYGVDRKYRERIEAVVAACRNTRLTEAYLGHFPPAP